jgi:Zn-dependent metalloprotease
MGVSCWGFASGVQRRTAIACAALTCTCAAGDRRAADVRCDRWATAIADAVERGQLRLAAVQADPLSPGHSIRRYEQYADGVRVFGAQLVARCDATGAAISVTDRRLDTERVVTQANLSPAEALSAARAALDPTAEALGDIALVLLPQSGRSRLCYALHLSRGRTAWRCFVDATDGTIAWTYSDVWSDGVIAAGRGVWGDLKKLAVDRVAPGRYEARDVLRPGTITTHDMRQQYSAEPAPGRVAWDRDSEWDDPAVADAHSHVGWAYDYFYRCHAWKGLDGAGRQPIAVLAHLEQDDYAYFFWWTNAIGFGDGLPGRTRALSTLDVSAHEFAHGITAQTWNGIYAGESGALNEAFSDIMGCAVEFSFQPPGEGRLLADYWIGEDRCEVFAPRTCAKRSLADPSAVCDVEGCHPDHYSHYAPHAGVHFNSGIAGHAFYLLVEGGRHRLSGIRVAGLGTARRERAERIFFRGFTSYLTPWATFRDARTATLQAARDLYGEASDEYTQTATAWRAVGVE